MEITYSHENSEGETAKQKYSSGVGASAESTSKGLASSDKPSKIGSKPVEQQTPLVFQFEPAVVLSIAQLAETWLHSAVGDLQAFARYYNFIFWLFIQPNQISFLHRHAHRSTINIEDVKLLARRNPSLVQLSNFAAVLLFYRGEI